MIQIRAIAAKGSVPTRTGLALAALLWMIAVVFVEWLVHAGQSVHKLEVATRLPLVALQNWLLHHLSAPLHS